MEKPNFNKLVEEAKNGSQMAVLQIAYHFGPQVQRILERSWHELHDYVAFEDYAYKHVIEDSIKRFDPSKPNANFEKFVNYRLFQLERKYIKRGKERRKKYGKWGSLDEKVSQNDNETTNHTIIPDDSLTEIGFEVSENIELRDKLTVLANGNKKKAFVLKMWLDGYSNDSELAMIVADRFGGQSSSARKFIQRFRESCKNILAPGKSASNI